MDKAIEEFKIRRAKRLDAKKADNEEGHWVTTKNNHKVHINDEGVPDKGNEHVIAAMTGTTDTGKITRKSAETYKSFADDINKLDKKGVVARAKKDPEFKELVDAITLYTQGAYGYQKSEARKMVEKGLSSGTEETAGEYFNDCGLEIKQLWNGQKLSESSSSLAGGIVSMMEAINNSEPYDKELYRLADDRNFGSLHHGKLYIPPKVGEKIKMDAPTSFTKNKDVLKEVAKSKEGDRIYYTLEPGARALDIERLSRYKQAESLTCGEFEVVSVSSDVYKMFRKKDADERNLERFKGRPTVIDENGDEWYGPLRTYITIRQVGKTEFGKREDENTVYFDCRNHFDGRFYNLDEDDDEGRWITTKNNHKVHLNEEGEPDKGNPHVIEKMTDGDDNTENAKADAPGYESKNKELKDNWLKGSISERAKRYWDFLEKLPVGTVLSDGADEYKKTGANEYTVEEYGDVFSTEEMMDEANFSFDDFVPQIKEFGEGSTEARPFPEEIGEEYEKEAAKEAIRTSATVFNKAAKAKKEVYGRTIYNPSEFNAAMEAMSALPVGSEIGNDYGFYIKMDGAWEDKRTGRKLGQFEAAMGMLEYAEFDPIKVNPPGKNAIEPLSERQKYHIAKKNAEEVASYRKTILGRASGKPDYDEIKNQLDAYCNEEASENASKEARAKYIAHIEDRNRQTLERIKSPKDIKTSEDATNYLKAKDYFSGDPIEVDQKVDLAGMYDGYATKVAERIDSIVNEYPFLRGQLDGLKCLSDEEGSHYKNGEVSAYAERDSNTVVLCETYFADPGFQDAYMRGTESGFHPAGTGYESIIDHEFTHIIEHMLNKKLDGKRASDIVMGRVAQRRFDLESPEDIESEYRCLVQSSVSGYSVDNMGTEYDELGNLKYPNYGRNTEFLAEAISAARCSANPNKTIQMAKEEFDRLVKEVFG